MCSISGVLIPKGVTAENLARINEIFAQTIRASSDRGRDSYGIIAIDLDGNVDEIRRVGSPEHFHDHVIGPRTSVVIVNSRAEPTTEWVKDKTLADVQPFTDPDSGWWIAHNGIVANDQAIRELFRLQTPTKIDSAVLPYLLGRTLSPVPTLHDFARVLRSEVVGSYALAAVNQWDSQTLFLAINYKPLTLAHDAETGAVFFTSLEGYFGGDLATRLTALPAGPLQPYSAYKITLFGGLDIERVPLKVPGRSKALVVCSGGLDSTVAATALDHEGYDVTLLHYDYGCRATSPERLAIEQIAARMHWPLKVVPLGELFTSVIGGSPLTNSKATVNTEGDGVAGAEFAHEWVPARNLILLSIAVGIAEAGGYDTVAVGTNLEEAGSYPDNEMEFVRRLDAVMPFATGSKADVKIVQPVGNLMKHEIVKLGHDLGAPIDLTWSCYNAGDRHCGQCGPCFMRKTAHAMHGLTDPVFETVDA